MRRGVVAFFGLTLVALGLFGCGKFGGEQRAAWRYEAEEACMAKKAVRPSAAIVRVAEMDGPGVCGMVYPHKISAFGEGTVGLTSRVTLACPIVPVIDGWIADTVQPAAELYYGTAVSEIRAGSYSCRPRNHQAGAKTSEHAFGNALDVMSFRFADGRELTVEKGWRGDPVDQEFLREVFVGACRHFTTVLAPGSDIYHYNHFHLDLARHDPRGMRRICKPILKFEPRLDPDAPRIARPLPRPAAPILRQPSEPPPDVTDDEDPYAISSNAPSRAPPAGRPAPVAALPASQPYPAARTVAQTPASHPAPGAPGTAMAASSGPVRLSSSALREPSPSGDPAAYMAAPRRVRPGEFDLD